MRRERGWSLIELTGSLVVLGAVCVIVGGLAFHAEHTRDLAAAYAADVAETRRALDSIERDVRAAHDVRAGASTLAVTTDGGDVAYALDHGSLSRDGIVLARNVAAFGASRDGALVAVSLELGRRSPDAKTTASVSTTVRLRAPRESR